MRVISRSQVDQPFLAPLGEQIYELIGDATALGGATKHSVAYAVVPSGKLSPRHYHKVSEETYYMLKGEAEVIIDGRQVTLLPGQACLILPGEVHQVFNHASEDLEFLVVCAPPWTPTDSFEV
jgi:mannose-6-phosphate isomerase-like protein (cupin superfamily)